MFGAGGAARAVGVELALAGVKHVWVVNRDPLRGQTLADLLNQKTPARAEFIQWTAPYAIPSDVDIVINATSIGLFPNLEARLDLDFKTLKPAMIVADIIPNPPRTQLIEEAEQRGCAVLDGLGMLVNPGVIGIKYWTGIDVDAQVMRSTIQEIFAAA